MITIKNTQRKIKIPVTQIKKDAQEIMRILGYHDFDLGIWFTTNKTIHTYNRDYRNVDKPTDVLSFSFHPDLKPGEIIQVESPDQKNLGDIIISAEYVYADPKDMGGTFTERLQKILVHGICHLLGYEHDTDQDFDVMQKIEHDLLRKIQK